MKKFLSLLLTMLLMIPALAEHVAIPVEIIEPAQDQIKLEVAITTAMAALPVQPEQCETRAELVRMSDGSVRWIITVFDVQTLMGAWSVELDASTGAVTTNDTAYDGFFLDAYDRWAAQKGVHALWSLADKQLYDALYALQPMYGLPLATDISAEAALEKALVAFALPNAEGFEVGYGYMTGGEGYNGMWEICLLKDGLVTYRVNLDAVTGEIYYMEPNTSGNG